MREYDAIAATTIMKNKSMNHPLLMMNSKDCGSSPPPMKSTLATASVMILALLLTEHLTRAFLYYIKVCCMLCLIFVVVLECNNNVMIVVQCMFQYMYVIQWIVLCILISSTPFSSKRINKPMTQINKQTRTLMKSYSTTRIVSFWPVIWVSTR